MGTLKLKPGAKRRPIPAPAPAKLAKPQTQGQRLALMRAWCPQLFNFERSPPPLAVGIAAQLMQRQGRPLPSRELRAFLFHWTASAAYLAMLAGASYRLDADGQQTPISDEHRQQAAQRLKQALDRLTGIVNPSGYP